LDNVQYGLNQSEMPYMSPVSSTPGELNQTIMDKKEKKKERNGRACSTYGKTKAGVKRCTSHEPNRMLMKLM